MADPRDGVKIQGTALITGAARRLGRALAWALAGQGADVVVHYHRSADEAASLVRDIRGLGVRAWPVQADLRDHAQVGGLFDLALREAGPIDVLVNNASVWPEETVWDMSEASLQAAMQIHVAAPLILSRCLAGQGRPGHIVNILDTRVTGYDKAHAAYHLSKRALLTLTRMLALELAPGVAVNGIAPGLILAPEGQDQTYLQRLAHTNPMNRHGHPQDVVDALLFLLRSRFVTGQVIYVDGGFHMKGHLYD
ncbi:MAG: SDR family oxidoreductase [Phycisphaerae bacterium]|nr:SDR family oxidoreductase [Phycisphaerae bacterium]